MIAQKQQRVSWFPVTVHKYFIAGYADDENAIFFFLATNAEVEVPRWLTGRITIVKKYVDRISPLRGTIDSLLKQNLKIEHITS